MMLQQSLALVQAAADPTRLRLLAALARGEATVAELVEVLEQSQPRVSRHLRLLSEAGLVEHFREGRWVYYRLGNSGLASELTGLITGLATGSDEQIRADAGRLEQLRAAREREALRPRLRLVGGQLATDGRPADEDLHAGLRQVLGSGPLGAVLDIGAGAGTVLRLLGSQLSEGTGVDSNRNMRLLARARLQAAGLPQCSLRDADAHALPFADGRFDLVIVDGVLHTSPDPRRILTEAVRVLGAGGKLLVIDRILPAAAAAPPTPAPTPASMLDEATLFAILNQLGLAPGQRYWLPGRAPDQALITAVRLAAAPRTGTND